jgi:hypothetical protein
MHVDQPVNECGHARQRGLDFLILGTPGDNRDDARDESKFVADPVVHFVQ